MLFCIISITTVYIKLSIFQKKNKKNKRRKKTALRVELSKVYAIDIYLLDI